MTPAPSPGVLAASGIVYTCCVDPERGTYIAFLADAPEIQAQAGVRDEAVGRVIRIWGEQHLGIKVVDIDELDSGKGGTPSNGATR